ncbi:hypothetical protein Q31b_15130 [Novipirellula aureliae]|uniref:Uncharacterized protein n=1 Tax=Novipirellula aureliae TaxID=2527966 RepID=A0A5C6E9Z7_9BACT|nr:hypothetical protein [Novipirellula aureliae]TWU43979.1 hypothetical protein Q31b_15130 [Novipirellula aureliae]
MRSPKRRVTRGLSFERLASRIALDGTAGLKESILETDTLSVQAQVGKMPYIETRGPRVERARPIVMGPIVMGPIISPDDLLIISSGLQKESDLSLPLIPAGGDETNVDGRAVTKSSSQNSASPQSLRDVVDNRYLSLDNGHVSYDLLPQPTAIEFNVDLDESLLPANVNNPRPTLASYVTSKPLGPNDELNSQAEIGILASKQSEDDLEGMRPQWDTVTDEISDQNRLTTDDYFSGSSERQRVDWSVDVSASASRGELAIDSAGEIVSETLGQESAILPRADHHPYLTEANKPGIEEVKTESPKLLPADNEKEDTPLSSYIGAAVLGIALTISLLDSERPKGQPRCYRFLRSRE